MTSGARAAVAPLYLLACLLLGGSAQGVWQNALLQIGGLAIIVWAAAWPPADVFPRSARPVMWIAVAALAVVALQCVPLPPSIWVHGARQSIADGYALLGQPVPALPLSLAPYKSLSSVLGLIPPMAIFCAITRLRAYRSTWLAIALLGGTIAGILLGILQVVGTAANPRWYLYPETNFGAAVGFFANANHMAMLLVIALPFSAAIGSARSQRSLQRASALLAALAGVGLLLLMGIALNGSIAAFALAPPVLAASALILFRPSPALRKIIGFVAVAMLAIGLVLLSTSSIGATKVGSDARESVASRTEILRTTGRAIADYFPAGSGLGSFRQVYRTYESPDSVTNEYVIHAHNDYAELILELGAAGLVLMAMFLAWWGAAVWGVWGCGEGGPYVRAASIASAVLLTHSLVEFPLRTAALAVVFAMCVALLADRRRSQTPELADLRPTRHVVIG
jgi:O-antigen ligase